MDVEPAAASEGSAKPEEEAAPAVKKDTKLSLQFGPPKAGLGKTQPSVFFGFFVFFCFFIYIFAPTGIRWAKKIWLGRISG